MSGNLKEFIKKKYNEIYNEFYEDRLRELLNQYDDLKEDSMMLGLYCAEGNIVRKLVEITLVYHCITKEDFDVRCYKIPIPILSADQPFPDKGLNKNLFKETTVFWIKDFNIVTCFDIMTLPANIKKMVNGGHIKLDTEEDSEKFKNAKVVKLNELFEDEFSMYYTPFLNTIYRNSKKGENVIKLINEYVKKCKNLYKMTISDFYDNNKELFYEQAVNVIISKNTLNTLTPEQKKQIINYILGTNKVEEIIKMILTYSFTASSIKKYPQIDFLDFTFISVELFKVAELIFNMLLNDFWQDKKIKDLNKNEIDFSNKKLELGKMKQFFNSKDKDIVTQINNNENLVDQLKIIMDRWISKTRNGFLHKDILNYEMLEKSITDSLNIICLLILILKK